MSTNHYDGVFEIEDEIGFRSLAELKAIEAIVRADVQVRMDSFIAPAVIRGYIAELHFHCLQCDTDRGLLKEFCIRLLELPPDGAAVHLTE